MNSIFKSNKINSYSLLLMQKVVGIFIVCFLTHNTAFSQKVLNGDFENNTMANGEKHIHNIIDNYAEYIVTPDSTKKMPFVYNYGQTVLNKEYHEMVFYKGRILGAKMVPSQHPTKTLNNTYIRMLQAFYAKSTDKSLTSTVFAAYKYSFKLSEKLKKGVKYRISYLTSIGTYSNEFPAQINDSSQRSEYSWYYSPLKLKIGVSKNRLEFGDSVGVTKIWFNNYYNKWQQHYFDFIATDTFLYITTDFSSINQNHYYYDNGPCGFPCNNLPCYQCEFRVYTYALFDNFELEEVCPLNLGKDTTLCIGESLNLKVPNYAKTTWNTSETSSSINVNRAGKYWCNIEDKGCFNSDTINIKFIEKQFNFLGKDSVICNGKPFALNPKIEGTYKWQNGDTTNYFLATITNQYTVEINNNGCVHKDTLGLIFNQSIFIGNDTTLCENENLVLKTTSALPKIWSTGDTTQQISVNNSGLYWLSVNQNNCFVLDSIKVQFKQLNTSFLGKDTILCDLQNIVLMPQILGNYKWNNGDTAKNIIINKSGKYSLTVIDSFCNHFDEINITQQHHQKIDIKTPIVACLDSLLFLTTNLIYPNWFDASFNLIDTSKYLKYIVNYPQSIYLQSGSFCKYWDTIEMQVKPCHAIDYNLFFPNVFSPNKDGKNEFYNPQAKDWNRIKMEIYNRWGEMVFSTEKTEEGWDGSYQNNLVQEGNYLVKITLKAKENMSGTNPIIYWSGMINVLK